MAKKNKFVWKDTSCRSRGEMDSPADILTLQLPTLRITVHRHIHYSPMTWLVSCRELDLENHALLNHDLEMAKEQALKIVRDLVAKMQKDLEP